MPYARNSDLPEEVRDALPSEAQSVFRSVVNEYDDEDKGFAAAWSAVKNGWRKDGDEWVRKSADPVTVAKVSDELGIVFGFALVSKLNGEDYFDSQGDHISEDVMMKAAVDYVESGAAAKEMHVGEVVGKVVFAWPMTSELAKSMGIYTNQTGLMIGMRPDKPDMLKKFKDGTYTGFSIGGRGVRVPVDD